MNDMRPTITGTGQPGATITVTEGGTVLGTTTVGTDGTWSLTPAQDLSNGPHTIVAEQDVNGVKSTAEGSFEVRVIAELNVTGPTSGAVVDTANPIVSGTAEPGATITITDSNGAEIGTATADEHGNWSTGIGTLPNGSHEITVTDSHGGSQTVDFTVDQAADFAELVVTSPAPENGAKPTVNEKTPTVSGTAEPGATITVTDQNGTVIGEGVADENGDWAITLPELENGEQKITVTDNHGGSAEVEFVVATEGGDTPMTAGSLAGLMLAGAAGVGLLIRRRQQAKAAA
ncbi:Ig-like domain-containing protein [Leucobacter sp. HNU]|uniref:Ig-like domain-containing protein n=1 Tax=Leucobacter sp. HNU TaxID=3236805 RepID=UPI003A806C43